MTRKQIEVLSHIFLHGGADMSGFSGRVLSDCLRKGWIFVDDDEPWVYSDFPLNQHPWALTDNGRQALHEAET